MKQIYRALAAMLGILLLISGSPVQAAQVNNGTVYPVSTNEVAGWPQGPDTYAETAILMDADTGTVLYNKGMDELRYPASTTKLLTLPDFATCFILTIEKNVENTALGLYFL